MMKKLQHFIALLLAVAVLFSALPVFTSAQDADTDEITALLLENAHGSLQATITPLGEASARPLTRWADCDAYSHEFPLSMERLAAAAGDTFTIGVLLTAYHNYDYSDSADLDYAWIMEIYKGSVAEKNYVDGAIGSMPAKKGLYGMEFLCDTQSPDNQLSMTPGNYIAVFGVLYEHRSTGKVSLACYEQLNFEVTAKPRPLQSILFRDSYGYPNYVTSLDLPLNRDVSLPDININFNPQNTTADRHVTAYSTDESIVTFSHNFCGLMKFQPVGPGDCQIIVKAGGKQAALNVHVTLYPTAIRFAETELVLHAGETYQKNYTCYPANANAPLRWYADGYGDVTVDDNGLLTVSDNVHDRPPFNNTEVRACCEHISAACNVVTTPHEFSQWEPCSTLSCTTPEAVSRICSVCGKEEIQILQENLGHNWDEGTVISGGTATEPGDDEPTPDPDNPGDEPTPDPGNPGDEPTPDPGNPGDEPTPDPGNSGDEPTPDPGNPGDEPAPQDTIVRYTCSRCDATRQKIIPLPFACDGSDLCPSSRFTDVLPDMWYHEAIDFAVTRSLFNGTSSTTFSPNKAMNRSMLVTVLHRLEGSPAPEAPAAFDDVKLGMYYADAVAWANENGIVTGVAEGRFNPNGKITREQLATILYRYAAYKELDVYTAADLSSFPDAQKVSAYALKPIRWAVAEGLITGNPVDGVETISPRGSASRAQVATMLMRFVRNCLGIDPLSSGQ